MMRAAAWACTRSRSCKTDSLRLILPLHSITARSFSLSTWIAVIGALRRIESSFPSPLYATVLPNVHLACFQYYTRQQSAGSGNFREVFGKSILGSVTSVSTESSGHLPLDMYNLGAFEFAVVSSTLLYSLTCLTA